MAKTPTRKSVYEQTYVKGTRFNNAEELPDFLKQKDVTVFLIKAGKNNDDTEYLVLKIDGINP